MVKSEASEVHSGNRSINPVPVKEAFIPSAMEGSLVQQ